MIQRAGNFEWPDVELKEYKDRPDTFLDVSRRSLLEPNNTQFQLRYFEVAPGGFTSFEQHGHEHCVVVIRGRGCVLLNGEWSQIGLHDAVYVGPNAPHQFRAEGDEPLGFLCIVDKDRDRPILLDSDGNPRTSE